MAAAATDSGAAGTTKREVSRLTIVKATYSTTGPVGAVDVTIHVRTMLEKTHEVSIFAGEELWRTCAHEWLTLSARPATCTLTIEYQYGGDTAVQSVSCSAKLNNNSYGAVFGQPVAEPIYLPGIKLCVGSVLRVHVLHATGLKSLHLFSTMSPLVRVNAGTTHLFQSHVAAKGGTNPKWNESADVLLTAEIVHTRWSFPIYDTSIEKTDERGYIDGMVFTPAQLVGRTLNGACDFPLYGKGTLTLNFTLPESSYSTDNQHSTATVPLPSPQPAGKSAAAATAANDTAAAGTGSAALPADRRSWTTDQCIVWLRDLGSNFEAAFGAAFRADKVDGASLCDIDENWVAQSAPKANALLRGKLLRAIAELKPKPQSAAATPAAPAPAAGPADAGLTKEVEALRLKAQTAEKELAARTSELKSLADAKVAEFTAVQTKLAIEEAKTRFLDSVTGTYPALKYVVVSAEAVNSRGLNDKFIEAEKAIIAQSKADAKFGSEYELTRRWVYHTCPADVIPLIAANGLRVSPCKLCPAGKTDTHDSGWFGIHTKGVYVSKHADYTMFYQNMREVRDKDTGSVMMFEAIIGRKKHFPAQQLAVEPTAGYNAHESPNHLEFFVFNPECTVPRFVIEWQAVKARGAIAHDH